jgi:hypothetical protein
MNPQQVKDFVAATLRRYHYEAPAPGTTFGTPWSTDKVAAHIEQLRAALVQPYIQEFVLADTWEQIDAPHDHLVHYWVVAETEAYCEFYDPSSGEFGLAEPIKPSGTPRTVGVRGDLVGVFCAM